MASRFVSGGTNEEPTERDEAWLKAQQEIEARRKATSKPGEQDSGKSLYETLQANKAAKQEAFEESIRLKNQFRSLDEDEVDFLDSVLESTRAKEGEVKKETSEQLDAFKRAQEEAEKAAGQELPEAPEASAAWTAGPRKRKKGRDSTIGGVKLRRTSTAEKQVAPSATEEVNTPKKPQNDDAGVQEVQEEKKKPIDETTESLPLPKAAESSTSASKSPSPPAGALGLAAYSSDEDD